LHIPWAGWEFLFLYDLSRWPANKDMSVSASELTLVSWAVHTTYARIVHSEPIWASLTASGAGSLK